MEPGQKIIGSFKPMGAFAATLGKESFAPVVQVSLGNDPRWRVGDQFMPDVIERGLSAIIDTGSDVTRIDIRLANKFHLKSVGDITSNFTGIPASTAVYAAQLIFEEQRFVLGGEFSAANFRDGGYYHDIILGWDVLHYFDMHLNSKLGIVALTFLGPS
ncbi:hypothetical protein [Methylocystis bryophila]|nr:hypothetical protein [Methylocystis bryophila]BDV38188.1 hypothetical protein DSM21852_14410 [Methylocystis bryophila]